MSTQPSPSASTNRLADASDRLAPQGEPLGPAVAEPAVTAPAVAGPVQSSGELPPVEEAPAVAVATPPPPAASQPAFAEAEGARPSFALTESAPQTCSANRERRNRSRRGFCRFHSRIGTGSLGKGPREHRARLISPRSSLLAKCPRPPEPAPPAHPSRHWVQVATGQDTSAFRFDWRRIVRNAGGLLDDAEAFTASWGQTNRLLTGPFDSATRSAGDGERTGRQRASTVSGLPARKARKYRNLTKR